MTSRHVFQARHVQYVDTAEEEWERFQKEIGDEMNVAQDILVQALNFILPHLEWRKRARFVDYLNQWFSTLEPRLPTKDE